MELKVDKLNTSNNFFIKETNKKEYIKEIIEKVSKDEDEDNKKRKKKSQIFQSRLNDYDSNLLENSSYKNLDNGILKLEVNIEKLEKKLGSLNSEINVFEGLDSDIQLTDLKYKRDMLETRLEQLNKEYEENSFSNKFSSKFSNFYETVSRGNFFEACADFLSRNILSKFSEKYRDAMIVKDSVMSLNKINSSVDELINMQAPYGENDEKYKKLTSLINRANYLHSRILAKKR